VVCGTIWVLCIYFCALVTNQPNPPVWVFAPNVLIPLPLLERLKLQQAKESFSVLPAGLLKTMARSPVSACQLVGHLDRVEAWLLKHLDPQSHAGFEQYPAWAMVGAVDAEPFTRFFGTIGSLELDRDGVRFTPPEVLNIPPADIQAFWAVVLPVLQAQGWSAGNKAQGFHARLQSPSPLAMEQASPWSVQSVRLTDYLPSAADCADWRRMWMNLQVELHNAPFNKAREAQGLKPLNALWFWGGGHGWQPQRSVPKIKSVSADGVCDAVQMTDTASQALNRFVFWQQLLHNTEFSEFQDEQLSSLYCLDFEGWGADAAAFDVLESEVLAPMCLAGLNLGWVLMGDSAWREIHSKGLHRWLFWKNKPNWLHLSEPVSQLAPDEEVLKAAWQAGLQEQEDILAQWEHRS
jgi:hypothetical protein